jgi:hypothetical protein
VFAPARKLALRSIGTRSGRPLRGGVVGRARLPTLSQRPHPPAARLAPSLVIGRHRRRSDAAFARASEASSGREVSAHSDRYSNGEVSARALRRQATPFPVEFQFATLNFQRRGPRGPKNNGSSTACFRPRREPGLQQAVRTRPRDPRNAGKSPRTPFPRHTGCFWSLTPLFQNAPLRSIPAPASEPHHWSTLPLRSVARPESAETGCPGGVRAKAFAKSHQPASRASGTFAKAPALAPPPKSVWPLTPVRSRVPSPSLPPGRRPASHPAVRRQNSAASRPDRGPPQKGLASRRHVTGSAFHPSHNTCLLHLPPH